MIDVQSVFDLIVEKYHNLDPELYRNNPLSRNEKIIIVSLVELLNAELERQCGPGKPPVMNPPDVDGIPNLKDDEPAKPRGRRKKLRGL